jgi:hypothetical protein
LVPAILTVTSKAGNKAWTEFKDAALSKNAGGGYAVSLYQHAAARQSPIKQPALHPERAC